MRFGWLVLALVLGACSTDTFVGSDAGDAGSADAADDTSRPDVAVLDAGGGDADIRTDGVECQGGSTYCEAGTQVCCGNVDWSSSQCTPNNGCDQVGSHPLICDDYADCAGGICCATITGGFVTQSICAAKCSAGDTQLCATDTECDGGTCESLGDKPSWLRGCH
jgi:hypothetical protein